MGVSASMIGQYETNSRIPKFATIKRISVALDATPDFILGLTDSPDTRLGTQFDFEHLGEIDPPEYSDDEIDVIEKFKRLPLDDRILIQKIIDFCFERFIKRENESHL